MKLKYKSESGWSEAPNIKVLSSELPVYNGEYEVTPKTYEDNELITKNRSMKDNVLIKKIPQYEVSNSSEGITLIIGEESLNG